MRISSINNISFKAKVADSFVKDGKRFLANEKNRGIMENFEAKVEEYKLFGTKDMTVNYRNVFENGQRMHALYVDEAGQTPVLLAKKDTFRKLVNKFMYINDYEFNIKVKQARTQK